MATPEILEVKTFSKTSVTDAYLDKLSSNVRLSFSNILKCSLSNDIYSNKIKFYSHNIGIRIFQCEWKSLWKANKFKTSRNILYVRNHATNNFY